MSVKFYGVKEAAKLLGISVRALQFYVERGLIEPDQPAWGKGSRRKFSKKNIVQLLVMRELSACGLDLKDIQEIIRGPKTQPSGFDPWDPDAPELDGDPITWFLIIYDRKILRYKRGDKDGNLQLSMTGKPPVWSAPEGGHASAIAVNITSLREKVKRL